MSQYVIDTIYENDKLRTKTYVAASGYDLFIPEETKQMIEAMLDTVNREVHKLLMEKM